MDIKQNIDISCNIQLLGTSILSMLFQITFIPGLMNITYAIVLSGILFLKSITGTFRINLKLVASFGTLGKYILSPGTNFQLFAKKITKMFWSVDLYIICKWNMYKLLTGTWYSPKNVTTIHVQPITENRS